MIHFYFLMKVKFRLYECIKNEKILKRLEIHSYRLFIRFQIKSHKISLNKNFLNLNEIAFNIFSFTYDHVN